MKCRSLRTLATREFHIRKNEIYNFKRYYSDRGNGKDIDAIVITNDSGKSFSVNYKWFSENFITLQEERDIKLKEILKNEI